MPHRRLRAIAALLATVVVIAASSLPANAGPILQLYLEGATYNTETESWELTQPGSSSGAPFRLWAIGNISGPGGKGTILDVKLSAVYDAAVGPINISVTPTKMGLTAAEAATMNGSYNGFTDPSLPGIPTLIQTVSDGSTPILGDGRNLPSHGEYGAGRVWQEFALGDFDTPDSQYGDFIGSFPEPGVIGSQISVYEISVTPGAGSSGFGEHPFTIHFDLYDHIEGSNHSKFAPFSHDGDGDSTIAPEPASMLLMGIGLLLVAPALVLFRRKQAAVCMG